jgi:hypothetical protein
LGFGTCPELEETAAFAADDAAAVAGSTLLATHIAV